MISSQCYPRFCEGRPEELHSEGRSPPHRQHIHCLEGSGEVYAHGQPRGDREERFQTSLLAGTFKRPNERNIPELRGTRFAFKCSGDGLRTRKSNCATAIEGAQKVGLLFLL